MTFPYRIAAIDLDETLLGRDHRVSSRNRRALRALADLGVSCVIASGRMHEATTKFAEEIGLCEPIISCNGAMVKDPRTSEVWHHVPVPAGPAGEIVRFCAERRYHLNFYLNDHLYVAERGRWAEFYVQHTGSPMEPIGDLRSLIGSAPTKLILIDAPEVTDRLLGEFRQRYGASLYITKTNEEYLEFMSPATDKGIALELVARRLGASRDRVIAFGDGNNDLPMVQWAGLGVAMATGKPSVKAVADAIAPPFDEDGLGVFIEQLLAKHGAWPPCGS